MNTPWGQSLESFLEEEGILEEANTCATKKILAWQIAEAMKEEGMSVVIRLDPAVQRERA